VLTKDKVTHYICKDCEWFQVKIRIGTKKKDGPVSGLKSAGPHGRFQSLGAAGPVSNCRLPPEELTKANRPK